MNVHYRKGSLLDYDGVYLAEGPWPGKAYFDAMRQARKRDAGLYMDYGYTRPNVVSRGPVPQGCTEGSQPGEADGMFQSPDATPDEAEPADEALPTPGAPNRMTSPPPTTSSVIWPNANGRKAHHAAHQVAEDAAIRRRPKLLGTGEVGCHRRLDLTEVDWRRRIEA
jgi:hypothetical protein